MKIFLDASVLVAAAGSTTGGSHYLFRVAALDASWQLLTSAYAVAEARRNVEAKLSWANDVFSRLLIAPELTLVHPPAPLFIGAAGSVIAAKDAPILAAAVGAQSDFLCTLDLKDFHKPNIKRWCRKFGMRIVTPKDLLLAWRAAS